MKSDFITYSKQVLADRAVTIMISIILVLSIAYCIYVGVSLRPSQLQVAVHYTAFGETFYYRDQWYYLLSFVAFGVVFAITHTMLIVKLLMMNKRQIALVFGWFSLFVLLIILLLTHSVLGIAFL
ncbi:MAG: hypothetical protein ABIQ04_05170 [Candidatus Saccharimonadales bacterium]